MPASDKLVDRLVKLGYKGPRPATAAQAHALIREARKRQDASGPTLAAAQPLDEVAAAIERLASQPEPTWVTELPKLQAELRVAYQRESETIAASRAKTTKKWELDLRLTQEHMRLKRRLKKLQLRLDG